nr:hypothetical protein [Tanacetum cinerariifolium]
PDLISVSTSWRDPWDPTLGITLRKISATDNTTPIVTTVTKAANKEKTPKEVDAAPKVNILDFCEEHYEDILPVIMDKIHRDKRKKVHARLDFGESPKKNRRVREDSQNLSVGTLPARNRSRSIKRARESKFSLSRVSKSGTSGGGHWKSKSKRRKPTGEEDLADQPKRHVSKRRSDFQGQPKEGRGEITFPPLATSRGTEGPLVIEAKIGGHMIHRMYVDRGSSVVIHYEHCFNRIRPKIKSQMVLATTSLTGFSGETIWPLGQLRLLVIIGDAESTQAWMNFMIVRSLSPYNGIIERPEIKEIQAVPSTAHGMLKFSVDGGIATIRSTIFIPTECATVTMASKEIPKEVEVRHENFKVALHPNFSDQEVAIGGPSDMTGVPRSVAEHRLNIREGYSPVRQKNRGRDPERARAIQVEVQKLVEVGIMKEVYYHDWLSNPVMVKSMTMVESDEEKTAFHTIHGVYCYTKIPFGLKNAGATYQRLVDKAFNSQVGRNIEVYVDDLVIKSHTETEMLRDIDEMFCTELKTLFTQQAEHELLQTTRDFHSCKQEEGQSVRSTLEEELSLILSRVAEEEKERSFRSWWFSAIPRDGIFEIDLSNSYANNSSIYAISNKRIKLDLDSAFLWHCRLGYISKKRIDKLQHDGLLNSTDFRAFEKCVPCMSGKMEKKPYTHQVKRAKDLLGLIHIDHKHEVFETFKVFQKEVENQLGKTIKSLHSDRGGEHMSQEFLDPLKDYGIISHRTPSYTPQHNDVSERRNKTLLDMNVEFLENSLITQEVSGSLEDLKIIQEEDMHPSIDTSLNHKEDDLEIDEPQSDIILIRRSTRTRRPINQIDYEETFSPVADIRAIRILIAIAAYYDYEIWQMDVKISFLNGYLSEEVYMEQPEGYVNPKYPNWEAVWVRKFISGLGVVPTIEESISMYFDNTEAITIANESRITKDDNLAGPFTKALAFPQHSKDTRNIGMLPTSSLM